MEKEPTPGEENQYIYTALDELQGKIDEIIKKLEEAYQQRTVSSEDRERKKYAVDDLRMTLKTLEKQAEDLKRELVKT